MFDRDRFVADCTASLGESDSQGAIHDHLARAVSDHAGVLAAMGEPREAGLEVLRCLAATHHLRGRSRANMTLAPRNHLMWALIGLYTGREDDIFWKQTSQGLRAGGAVRYSRAMSPRCRAT